MKMPLTAKKGLFIFLPAVLVLAAQAGCAGPEKTETAEVAAVDAPVREGDAGNESWAHGLARFLQAREQARKESG